MSLPPHFIDELRARLSLAQVVGRKVTFDTRKSNPGKGDMWAPCPFHQEKTASFHVDDRKGFYYCFGCHAKGDAVSFVRETENVGFMEAVEILAREAGMPMPERDPVAARTADRNSQLAGVMEQAVQHYRLMLNASLGADARAYLDRRAMDMVTRDRFDVGFAPDLRQGLFTALTAKGVAPDLLVEAGLCAQPDAGDTRGAAVFDRFRGRIIFPIRDVRGRCIGLGGRAMDPDARAKYLNSPETPLFDKGRSLYNHAPAREAAGKGKPLIVAEGYMDVIALVSAGFEAAVAPLGTAVTADQLRLMWRIHPEPVIALDGDTAGIRAALRVVDLALPLLEAGQGLRFAVLPQGQDPDDLIRAGGPAAMQAVLDAARPMVDLLWHRETEGKSFDSPERRASLDKSLRAAIRTITDPSIRSHYDAEVRRLRNDLFTPTRPLAQHRGGYAETGLRPAGGQSAGGQSAGRWSAGGTAGRWSAGSRSADAWPAGGRSAGGLGARRGFAEAPAVPLAATRASYLAQKPAPGAEDRLHEAMILAICVRHPSLILRFESELEQIALTGADHDRVRSALLRAAHAAQARPDTFGAEVEAIAGADLENLLSLTHVAIAPPVRATADPGFAETCLAEELAKLRSRRGARAEIADAEADLPGLADEGLTWRLRESALARHRADKPPSDDAGDVDGEQERLSRDLQNLIDGEVWRKK